MKHEVEFKSNRKIRIEELESNDYIGFIANGNKWFILYANASLVAISFDKKGHYANIRTPNEIYTTAPCKTVKQCIDVQYGVSKVLKFDTAHELFIWLAEN